MNPHHNGTFLACFAGGPYIQVETVLALLLRRLIIHRTGRISSLGTLWTKGIALTNTLPRNHWLRGFPAQIPHRRSGERNSFEAANSIRADTGDYPALHLDGIICSERKREPGNRDCKH